MWDTITDAHLMPWADVFPRYPFLIWYSSGRKETERTLRQWSLEGMRKHSKRADELRMLRKKSRKLHPGSLEGAR